MSELSTVTFPQAGISTTRLGFGCASLMRVTSAKDRQRLLGTAFDAGVRHFDVARLYGLGAAEGELGRFARGRREQLTIATKFGIESSSGLSAMARFQAPARAFLKHVPAARRALKRRDEAFSAPRRYDAETARRSFDKSLQELGVDYVDLLFIHDPTPYDDVPASEIVSFFERLRTAGKVRAWGVSQDAHPDLRVIDRLGDSALLQVRDDVFDRARFRGPTLTFGFLARAHERISGTLNRVPELRRQWNERIGTDLTTNDALARLLLGDALATNPAGAVLFSSTRTDRVSFAASVVATPPPAAQVAALRELVAHDRVALVR